MVKFDPMRLRTAEVQQLVRDYLFIVLADGRFTAADVARDTGLSGYTVCRWFYKQKPARIMTVHRIIDWMVKQSLDNPARKENLLSIFNGESHGKK